MSGALREGASANYSAETAGGARGTAAEGTGGRGQVLRAGLRLTGYRLSLSADLAVQEPRDILNAVLQLPELQPQMLGMRDGRGQFSLEPV